MVFQLARTQQVQQALEAIANFEKSKVPGVWPGLNKSQIVAEMRSRVTDPFQVNQGGQPFCGPATIVFELVRRDPLRYVEICRSLFLVGGFHTQSQRWISPSPRLRGSQGNLRMPQVDWMLLATLRESENLIFAVDANAPEILRNMSGMTKSWEIAGWVREILGCREVQYHHAYFVGDIIALQKAADAINAGGVALALITAEGMLGNRPPLVAYPSHWIVLLGNIAIQSTIPGQAEGGRLSFDIYTWARQMRVDLAENPFKNYFWGAVTGRP